MRIRRKKSSGLYISCISCMYVSVQAHFVGWRMTTDLLLNDATFFGVKEVSGKRPGRARWPLFGLLSQTHLVFIFPICPLSQVGIDSDRQREMWWIMDATQPTGQPAQSLFPQSLSLPSLSLVVSGCPRCFWKYQKGTPSTVFHFRLALALTPVHSYALSFPSTRIK